MRRHRQRHHRKGVTMPDKQSDTAKQSNTAADTITTKPKPINGHPAPIPAPAIIAGDIEFNQHEIDTLVAAKIVPPNPTWSHLSDFVWDLIEAKLKSIEAPPSS
jgi:hypothetical protein